MSEPTQQFLELLQLVEIDSHHYRGKSGTSLWNRVFGGHVIAQALMAVQKTVAAERYVHSLHAYFLRPGNPEQPIDYIVEITRDGGSFSTRRVQARQDKGPIFTLSASFHDTEPGLTYQRPLADNIPTPETILAHRDVEQRLAEVAPQLAKVYANTERPFRIVPVDIDNYLERKKETSRQQTWIKLNGRLANDRLTNAAILAYLSDMTLLDTALFVHRKKVTSPDIFPASLDHAMWFHRPFDVNGWLLYDCQSPNSSGGTGLSQGYIYDQEGRLIASTCQEGLLRLVPAGKGNAN